VAAALSLNFLYIVNKASSRSTDTFPTKVAKTTNLHSVVLKINDPA